MQDLSVVQQNENVNSLQVQSLLTNMVGLKPSEINRIGAEIQQQVSSDIDEITSRCKAMDCGQASKVLQELTSITDASVVASKNTLLHTLSKPIRMFRNKGKSIAENLDIVINNVANAKEELKATYTELESLIYSAKEEYQALHPLEVALNTKVEELTEALATLDTDSFEYMETSNALSAYIRRAQDIATSRIVAGQTIKECFLLANTNQVLSDNMQYTLDNLVPLYKQQCLLASNVQLQKQSVLMNKQIRKSVNYLMVDTAKTLSTNVANIHNMTTTSIIETKTLEEVNSIMHKLSTELYQKGLDQEKKQKEFVKTIQKLESSLNDLPSLETGARY